MTVPPSLAEPAAGSVDEPPVDDGGDRRTGVAYAVATGVAVALVRWWVSHERRVFHITPDEPGQLAMARFLGGGTRWFMGDHSTWRPGYATLIAPIHWFTDDPATGLRVAFAVNAVLGGVAAVLAFVLARRLTGLAPGWCAVVTLLVSLAPAALFPTAWVWAEALVAVLVATTVLAAMWFVDAPSLGRGLGLATSAVAAFTTHSRLLPLVAVTVGVVVLLAVRRRLDAPRAAAVVAYTAVATVLSAAYAAWIVDRVWDDPTDFNTAGTVLEKLTLPWSVAISAVGQLWYQLVTTAGVFGIGLVVLVRAAGRRGTAAERDEPRPLAPDARIVLACVLPLVLLSVVFMADRSRPDQIVYGRYNDGAVTPVLIVGVGALVGATRRVRWRDGAMVLGATAVTGALLWIWRRDELAAGVGVRSMVLGLHAHIGTAASIPVVRITLVAIAATALVLLAARSLRPRPGLVVAVVLGALVLTGVARTRPAVDATLNSWTDAAAVREVEGAVLAPGEAVRFRLVPTAEDPRAAWGEQRQRRMLYQFYLPHNPMIPDDAPDAASTTPYVFAPMYDPELLLAGAEVVWRDPAVPMGLYRVP